MNDPNLREEAIFDGALQLPAGQRVGYIEAACAGDATLLKRIRALLAAHEQGGGPLDESAVPPPRKTIALSLPPAEKPGDRIGHYKILQLIGEGGCGSVYMAEQEQPV